MPFFILGKKSIYVNKELKNISSTQEVYKRANIPNKRKELQKKKQKRAPQGLPNQSTKSKSPIVSVEGNTREPQTRRTKDAIMLDSFHNEEGYGSLSLPPIGKENTCLPLPTLFY